MFIKNVSHITNYFFGIAGMQKKFLFSQIKNNRLESNEGRITEASY